MNSFYSTYILENTIHLLINNSQLFLKIKQGTYKID